MTINIENIKPGDTVTLEHPDGSRLVGEASAGGLSILTATLGDHHLDTLERRGWSITDHKPRVELPTEPGIYVGTDRLREGPIFATIGEPGQPLHYAHPNAMRGDGGVLGDPERFAPFVRLVPEGENRAKIAAEVIEWCWSNSAMPQVFRDRARKHFGVS